MKFLTFMLFFLLGMDYVDQKRKGNFVGKVFLAAALTTLCIIMIRRSPSLNSPSPVILHDNGQSLKCALHNNGQPLYMCVHHCICYVCCICRLRLYCLLSWEDIGIEPVMHVNTMFLDSNNLSHFIRLCRI